MNQVTIEQARTIIAKAFAEGEVRSLKPLSVAVLDPGGHLIAFERQDGASTLRHKIAAGKAAGALALGVSSRKIAEMAVERPTFVGAVGTIAPDGIIPAAGGLIIVGGNDEPLGAVGVTGDTSDNDELCAIAGIQATGLDYRP
ncbi:MAG: heme-binding protein [Candidatus Sphingomonas phytovorans]|nr:heme-binding protein [Sphingomonas sp.]WEK02315.1 MAG: heme-binding protein [Sphingomonas sp.]